MPKKKRKKKKSKSIKNDEFYAAIIRILIFVLVIVFIIFFLEPVIRKFISRNFIRFESSINRSGLVQESMENEIPLQGSFTELFSGVGWKNPLESNVYQDFKTLTVSFPPAYNLEETDLPTSNANISTSEGVVEVGGRKFAGGVQKNGGQYEGYLYELKEGNLVPIVPTGSVSPVFISQYPGNIILSADGSSKFFLLYSAYEGEALEFQLNPPISSSAPRLLNSIHLNARVTEEGKIEPQIFHKDNAWWIFSGNGTPKLLRVRSGLANDFTNEVLSALGVSAWTAVPAAEDNVIYLISSDKVFRLEDIGFKKRGKLAWESLRLNAWDGEVVKGRFTKIDDSKSNIRYYLSNNGGRDWEEAKLNEFVQFKKTGGDFRWRAELYPTSGGVYPLGGQYESSWIKQVGVEYYVIRGK